MSSIVIDSPKKEKVVRISKDTQQNSEPDYMKKIIEAKRKLSKQISLTSIPAGVPAVTTSCVPLGIRAVSSTKPSRSTKDSDRDGDSDDGGRH